MRQMLDVFNRIRNFDPRKLTPMQIVVGIAAAIIAIFVVWQIIKLFLSLLPIAIGILGIYLAYRWLSSNAEELPEEMTKSKNERMVDEALANVKAASSGTATSPTVEGIANTSAQVVDEAAVDEVIAPAQEEAEENLAVKQIINPETGFKEPDISRLIEREQEKLKEADRVNEDVMSQIEKRRQRLLGKDGK
ncbi:MAG: hypothetical protein Q9P01_09165 [Anaerolineae bacterium]|nr:hypothetical protein [Anaerolineae bacterium]MDQ7034986.1 hypothetical protein [Anaerolineae bacterium]